MLYESEINELFKFLDNKVSKSKVNLSDLNMGFKVAVPRIDYYLSYKSLILEKDYKSLLDEYFTDGLHQLLTIYYNQGRLNSFGHVTDTVSYISFFNKLGIYYHWIPKNACTHYKKVFVRSDRPDFEKEIVPGRFHESINEEFGMQAPIYIKNKNDLLEHIDFAIYRDPIERFVSCYIDKFLKPIVENRQLEPFIESIIKSFYSKLGINDEANERSISFDEFLFMVLNTPAFALNEHWRPQADFLHGLELDVALQQDEAEDWMIEKGFIDSDKVGIKANSSVGKTYTPGLYRGGFESLLPRQIVLSEVLDYSQFVSNFAKIALEKFYQRDYQMIARWRESTDKSK